jgi:UTP--glucose-1-phosphate uridylyltransferase
VKVRKAVFPVAGLGTRFLPATKVQPKEMLPIVDKPAIQYAVEEVLAAGIEDIIMITGRGKNAIEDHFDRSVELEHVLAAQGKEDLLKDMRRIAELVTFCYIRQKVPLGLGHAVLVAKDVVGEEPFAVVLPDDLIDAPVPATAQLLAVFNERV